MTRIQGCSVFRILMAPFIAGGFYSFVWPDCPAKEVDKFHIDSNVRQYDVDGDDDCLPTELLLECHPSWCSGGEDTGLHTWYCSDASTVRAWADEQGYVLVGNDDDGPDRVHPRCEPLQAP